ncbi:MAG: hypothetical protein RLZZ65_695 [Bacteroidota bacterium]|jgi:hypothetical protein
MKLRFFLLFSLSFIGCVQAQELGPTDTLKGNDRVLGSSYQLMHSMDGFSQTFFIMPNSGGLQPQEVLHPENSFFASAPSQKKDFLFSALPHLGFAYGFGSGGSQKLRVDYEQAFAHQLLFNLRYDRWQRNGFLRADELRFSGLQLLLFQQGKKHQIQLAFENQSDDRQWSGGITQYSALSSLSLDLMPVNKERSSLQKNKYQLELNMNYRIIGDSVHYLALASEHIYQQKKRTYFEFADLNALYGQTYLNADTCADLFQESFLENNLGMKWKAAHWQLQSMLGIKQRAWSDPFLKYDTTEINLDNQLRLKWGSNQVAHQSRFNLTGAANGLKSITKYSYSSANFDLELAHNYSNEWPMLMQRAYFSNLTQYAWLNPQKQLFQEISPKINIKINRIDLGFSAGYYSFASIYRFDLAAMQWSNSGVGASGHFYSLGTRLAYYANKNWKYLANYAYLKQENFQNFPTHTANVSVLWSGGVFKDKRLKLTLEAQAQYQSATRSLVFVPFMQTIDWGLSASSISYSGAVNAQLNAAIEVKTFRFFLNVANMGTYWLPKEWSSIAGYPIAGLQVRVGLTWDFWN